MAELEISSIEDAKEHLKQIDPEGKLPKPSEEEIKEAYNDFAKAFSDFNNKQFEIGPAERANEFADYLLSFIEKRVFWTKQGWMGVLRLNEEIQQIKENNSGTPFSLGYQALEFTYFALTNVGGIGFQSAKDMEKESALFAEIVQLIENQVNVARNDMKELEFLKEKWAAYTQGFYYEREVVENPQGDGPDEVSQVVE